MDKIPCVIHLKEFTVTEDEKDIEYIAVYPSTVDEKDVDEAIHHKFKYNFDGHGIEFKRIVVMLKEQYEAVFKPQFSIIAKYNQNIEEAENEQIRG